MISPKSHIPFLDQKLYIPIEITWSVYDGQGIILFIHMLLLPTGEEAFIGHMALWKTLILLPDGDKKKNQDRTTIIAKINLNRIALKSLLKCGLIVISRDIGLKLTMLDLSFGPYLNLQKT